MIKRASWAGLAAAFGLWGVASAQPVAMPASAPVSVPVAAVLTQPPASPVLSYSGCMAQLGEPAIADRLPMLRNTENANYVCSCAQGRRLAPADASAATAAAAAQRAAVLLGCAVALLRRLPESILPSDAFLDGLGKAMAPAGGGVTLPLLQFDGACARPVYPVAAARAEATGTTQLMLRVSPSGDVSDAHVLRSAGPTREHKLLDASTMQAMKVCRFTPAIEGGRPIDAWTAILYTWRLQ